MVSGFQGHIPKRDAHTHIYMYTLSENSVPRAKALGNNKIIKTVDIYTRKMIISSVT